MSTQSLFQKLWDQYTQLTPQANDIKKLFEDAGEIVSNDHIALRTFSDARVNLNKLSQAFLKLGYEEKAQYRFEKKKLNAKHFEHPDGISPKVFISQLELDECSPWLKETVTALINQMDPTIPDSDHFPYIGCPWKVSHETYTKLYEESEYAAWVSAFGYCANHFTVDCNRLKLYPSVASVNDLVKKNGYKLNTSGGEIKGSKDVLLEQSSTVASKVKWTFSDGIFEIPSCFYEFAFRHPLKTGALYQGFVEASADKIFESTN